MVSVTGSPGATPFALRAPTRNSYTVLGARPVREAEVAFAAVDVALAQSPRPFLRCSTSKPVSSLELSAQVRSTVVGPVAVAARPVGASGAPSDATWTTLLGEDTPLAFLAFTRNS